jgi:hypothetical protein
MWLGIIFLTGTALLGVCLTRRVMRGLLDVAEQVLWGTVVGWILATFCIYLWARWQGRLTHAQVVWIALAAWVIFAALLFRYRRSRTVRLKDFWRPHFHGLVILLSCFAPVYWWLLHRHVFAPGPGGLYAGSAAFDLNFHSSVATSFAFGENFPPTYTLLPPEPMLYPYLPDFHAATLIAAGFGLRATMMITALWLGLVTVGLFYCLAFRIAASQKTAALAAVLFLLNGGFGFIDFLRDWWHSGKTFFQFWNTLAVNYAMFSERGLHWTNIVVDMLIPQRTSLFGLPLGLMIFTIFAVVWQRWHPDESELADNSPRDLTLLLMAGGLAGVLPLFHTHTYIAVGLVSAILFGLRPRRVWLAFWIPAIVIAAPQILSLAQRASMGSGIIRWLPGGLGHDAPFFPLYLLRNFGLPLLLAVPAWIAAPRAWRKFYLAFVFLFVFSFLIVVSPNVFDNQKFTYYWHALNSVLVAAWLVKLATVYRQRLIASLLAFVCVVTALVVFQSENIAFVRTFGDDEVNAAVFVREHTAPHSLFLTAPSLNQPLMCLAGRAVVRGATAWLWSHGYEFRERESDVRRIYAGKEDALDLLRFYGVDYIYLGNEERAQLKANQSFFDNHFPVIYRAEGISIYDARSARGGTTEPAPAQRFKVTEQRELASRLDSDPYALLIEFPRTSFFVYRLCKASFGRMPRRDEFMEAITSLGHDLFIGSQNWKQKLDTNTTALLESWIKREEFSRVYENRSNRDFVAAVLQNAGLQWSSAERDSLVGRLDSGAETRGLALRQVVEDKRLLAREYNNAYVLMHYFGYLARNPDDPPDYDLKGLNFWRDVLDRSGDYRSISKAFLESIEYNAR